MDGATDLSAHLLALLAEHRHRWQEEKSYLYVDSASDAAKYLDAIDGFGLAM